MKTSVVFPQFEFKPDPVAIKDYAQAVEGLGLDCLQAPDHVIAANPDRPGGIKGRLSHRDLMHESLVLFGYLAGLTERIELATGVVVLPARPAVLVAKQAATVDVLSGGRLRLGVASGETDLEMQALGYDFRTRGRRIEEQVHVLRQLWTQELVSFEGEFHTIDDMGLNPLPVQRPIPIWFGGEADVVIRRIARLGDGWMLNQAYPDDARPLIDKLHQYLDEEGRTPDQCGVDIRISIRKHPRETLGQLAEEWRDLGVAYLGVNTMGAGFVSPDEHLKAVRLFKEETGL